MKSMDLKDTLKKIFEGGEEKRIQNIYKILKKLGCIAIDDLKYLNEKDLENTKLTLIEKNKLLSYASDVRRHKSIIETLEKIFGGKNEDKLDKIKEYLKEIEVNFSDDLGIVDLDQIRNNPAIFSQQDISKIRNWIRKEHPESFKDIKAIEEGRNKKLDVLYNQSNMLLKSNATMNEKYGDLLIAQTRGCESSVQPQDFLSPLFRKKRNVLVEAMGALAGLVSAGSGAYSDYKRYEMNSKNKHSMEEMLKNNKEHKDEVDDDIKKLERSVGLLPADGAQRRLKY